MRITIDISVANDPDAHRWLDRMLDRIEDGWHVWDLTDTSDAEAIEATRWVCDPGRQGNRLRELLVASTRLGAWTLAPHTRPLRVTAHPAAPDELAPEQAFRLADEPLVILVENSDGDGAFVARVVTSSTSPFMASGDAKENQSDSTASRRRADAAGSRETGRRSDVSPTARRRHRQRPEGSGRLGEQERRRLRETCDRHGLPCWVLAKREAENYLPRVLLGARPNAASGHERMVEAWDRLSDDQKTSST